MRKNTFLIRFIDIGLIILFGFIVISDITVRSQIELPGSDPSESEQERDLTLFVVNIDANDQYRLTDINEEVLYGTYSGLENLETALLSRNRSIRSNNEIPVALIQMDEEAVTMQRLVNVLDLCDTIGIAKNVNVKSFRL